MTYEKVMMKPIDKIARKILKEGGGRREDKEK
jgi:hypothetical protein